MVQAVTRLYDTHAQAAQAVRELKAAGISDNDISLIAKDGDVDNDNEAAEGAAEGATAGGLLGAGAGLLAGLGMLAIPGLGPVVAAGWLVSTVAGAAAGAVAGGATGGILGALKDAGHSDEDAHVYAEGVRRGGSLVSVRPDNEAERVTAEQILNRGGVDAAQRGVAYRESGWARFDESASPYSAEDMAAERRRYAETRSFTTAEPGGELASDKDSFTSEPNRPIDPTLRTF